MRIVIVTVRVPFLRGGAEDLARGLRDALRDAGHRVELVAIPFKWSPAESILDHMLACRLLDLTSSSRVPIDLVIGLKFPAYLVPAKDKVIWLLHQHRQAYDHWGLDICDLDKAPSGLQIRSAIREADNRLMPQARAIYTISRNVSSRLQTFNGLSAAPLYHPPRHAGRFRCESPQPYLYCPSRLCQSKRQTLVLHALARTREPVRVRFSGATAGPDHSRALQELARKLGVADRVDWLGYLEEDDKRDQFAHATAIVFPPYDEDYGYVTLEAMLASKPVITCTDSGGPLEFVQHEETGLVTDPAPAALAEAFDRAWTDPAHMQRIGAAGREKYESMNITWSNVVDTLLG